MRLKSEIWVQALLRRCFAQGMFGAVLRKGAEEAGTIYVVVNRLDGTVRMLGPPPGSSIDEIGDRLWIEVTPPVTSPPDVQPFIDRLVKFDPDIWVVEIEDRGGTAGLTILPAP